VIADDAFAGRLRGLDDRGLVVLMLGQHVGAFRDQSHGRFLLLQRIAPARDIDQVRLRLRVDALRSEWNALILAIVWLIEKA